MKTTIQRYLFGQMLPPFVLSVLLLVFVFLMTRIVEITRLIVNYRVKAVSILRMLVYMMPFFLQFVIPMGVMLAILLTFMRMSSDNEIVALKAGGVSLYGLLPPALLFALGGALLTAWVCILGVPWGQTAARRLLVDVAVANFDASFRERSFMDRFPGLVLYVDRVDSRRNRLENVFIDDHRTAGGGTVVAPRARIASDPASMTLLLRLFDGTISRVDPGRRTTHTIRFDTYDLRLDLARALGVARKRLKDEEEMGLAELRDYLATRRERDDRYYLAQMAWYRKFSLPCASLALGLLAVPLGVGARDARRGMGIVLGLGCFLAYYLILSVGWVFGESGDYPPIVGMWLPNLVMGLIGAVLVYRAATERPLWPLWRLRRPAGRMPPRSGPPPGECPPAAVEGP